MAFAVEKMSKRLEVNDVKSKVRRIEQLPEHDETGKNKWPWFVRRTAMSGTDNKRVLFCFTNTVLRISYQGLSW